MSEREAKPPPDAPLSPEEEDREAILARRARFVATALVGLTGLSACDPRPQPCLNIAPVATTSPTDVATATPCLSPPMPQEDAGAPQPCLEVARPPDPPPTTGSKTSRDAGPPPADAGAKPAPVPCLSMPWPSSKPQPCLTPPRPPPDDGKK